MSNRKRTTIVVFLLSLCLRSSIALSQSAPDWVVSDCAILSSIGHKTLSTACQLGHAAVAGSTFTTFIVMNDQLPKCMYIALDQTHRDRHWEMLGLAVGISKKEPKASPNQKLMVGMKLGGEILLIAAACKVDTDNWPIDRIQAFGAIWGQYFAQTYLTDGLK